MTHLDLVTILVNDMEKTKAFYVDHLGFSEVEQFRSPGGEFVWLRSERKGSCNLALHVADTPRRFERPTLARIPVESGGLMIGFEVDDAEQTYRAFLDAGLDVRTEIFDMGKGRSFGAVDPEGNCIQCYDVYPHVRELQRQLGLE